VLVGLGKGATACALARTHFAMPCFDLIIIIIIIIINELIKVT